jgi:hypothetical protein
MFASLIPTNEKKKKLIKKHQRPIIFPLDKEVQIFKKKFPAFVQMS